MRDNLDFSITCQMSKCEEHPYKSIEEVYSTYIDLLEIPVVVMSRDKVKELDSLSDLNPTEEFVLGYIEDIEVEMKREVENVLVTVHYPEPFKC